MPQSSPQPELTTPLVQYPEFPVIPEKSTKGIICSKSPCRWTQSDLSYFRIYTHVLDVESFFRGVPLRDFQPETGYSPFLTEAVTITQFNFVANNSAERAVRSALFHIRHIHFKNPFSSSIPREILTNRLACHILNFVGMEHGNSRYTVIGQELDFFMCGCKHKAEVDVAVVHNIYNQYIFFLVEDKRSNERKDPIAQLVANSIAAFQSNNRIRQALKFSLLKTMIFPAMTFRGSSPSFYLIRITKELSDAVINGVSPDFSTAVSLMCPPINPVIGLCKPEARGIVLRILENMKDFTPTTIEEEVPEGWKRLIEKQDIYEPVKPKPVGIESDAVGSDSDHISRYNFRPRKPLPLASIRNPLSTNGSHARGRGRGHHRGSHSPRLPKEVSED